jgi:DNA-binding transcriptional regulator GbsR (MarR family)
LGGTSSAASDKMDIEGEEMNLSNVPDEFKEKLKTLNSEIAKYTELLKNHEAKLQKWKVVKFLTRQTNSKN